MAPKATRRRQAAIRAEEELACPDLERMTPDVQEPKQRTESLYFRTSARLRECAEQYAEDRGLTLSSALSGLVERGLEAITNEPSIAKLEERVQELDQQVAVMQERDRSWHAMFSSLQGHLRTLRVGNCPACRKPVTANDQFLVRRCPWENCGDALNLVLTDAKAEEFPPALAALVGALGGFLFGISAAQGPP